MTRLPRRLLLSRFLFFVLASSACATAAAQTTITGDAWIAGDLTVGSTAAATASLDIRSGSATGVAFQVSGVDETPFLRVGKEGKVGLSTFSSAQMDVNGTGDASDIGLQLRGGSLYPATSGYQIAFGYDGSANLRHAMRTVHSTSAANNSMDFFLWNASVASTTVGSLHALSLMTSSTETFVHVLPAGAPDVELEVSNGAATGGGVVHRALESTHSSRALKTDIAYLGVEEDKRAYEDVTSLHHAEFRYKRLKGKSLVRDKKQPLLRGLIYEDAPDSIKGTGESIVIDERVINAELALKELIRRLEDTRAWASRLESK